MTRPMFPPEDSKVRFVMVACALTGALAIFDGFFLNIVILGENVLLGWVLTCLGAVLGVIAGICHRELRRRREES